MASGFMGMYPFNGWGEGNSRYTDCVDGSRRYRQEPWQTGVFMSTNMSTPPPPQPGHLSGRLVSSEGARTQVLTQDTYSASGGDTGDVSDDVISCC